MPPRASRPATATQIKVALSSNGVVVGASKIQSKRDRAVIYVGDQPLDPGDLTIGLLNTPLCLNAAIDVNDAGQIIEIVCGGSSYLLNPAPLHSSAAALHSGLVTFLSAKRLSPRHTRGDKY